MSDSTSRREFTRRLAAIATAMALPEWAPGAAVRAQPGLRVNGDRLNAHLAELSRFGRNPQGGVSRIAYSEADKQGRDYVMGLMRTAKLEVRIDTAGNILGRRAGRDAARKPLLFGSHIDSVPEGGNYDGDVGSLGAIEVAQTLAERGVATRHPIEVVVFQNEEGGLFGSKGMIGELGEHELAQVSKSGKTIREGVGFLGGDPSRLAEAKRGRGDIAAYVELHIEQGGTLDLEKIDIGVVEGIVGINGWDVRIEGFANHAGTTAMNNRHDALLTAARYIDMVNRVVTSIPGRQVATVGRIQALPGAPNVIPGDVTFSLEIRDLDAAKIRSVHERIKAEGEKIVQATGTRISYAEANVNIPAPTTPRVREVIAAAAKQLGLTSKQMPSGAGHDAQDMARIAPIGMIFVPSVGGISHSPKELSRPQDITNGANVLLHTILALDALDTIP
jgi:N-carbamoyl-L-amino-acid hydrolase